MRRKSTRNQKKSIDNSESDSPQKPTESISTRSSRRRKRSPSISTNEEAKKPTINETNKEAVEEQISSDVKTSNDIEINPDSQLNDSKNNDKTENLKEDVIKDDKEINLKEKGKSKGKNKTKSNHSGIDIETKNDDVQGESVSPPNENKECLEYAIDSVQKVSEKPEHIDIKESDIEIQNKEQSTLELTASESESRQNNISGNIEDKMISDENQEKIDVESKQRSTTPALPTVTPDNKSTDEENFNIIDSKIDKSETEGKKRITLKRSSSLKIEQPQASSNEEINSNDVNQDKQTKKITLKRRATDEIPSGSEDSQKSIDTRRSSLNETISDSQKRKKEPDQPKDTINETKRLKLIRSITMEPCKTETFEKSGRKPWGKSEGLDKISVSLYNVDVDYIKTICPCVEFLKESEIKLKSEPRERIKSESSDVINRKLSLEKSEDETDKHVSEPESAEEQSNITPNPNIIALNRKISIVDDTASKLRAPASPAKNPRSEILYITNLVRPFTLKHLKELLERTGKIREDGFWTDRIKSKCYAHYETEEEAEATRNALHGVNWPIGNGKQLVIDFGTEEDMQKAKNPVPAVPVVPEIIPEKENRFQEPEKVETRQQEQEIEEKKPRHTGRDRSREEQRRRHSRSRSREDRKHTRRSYTPEVPMKKKPKKEDLPPKLMDDLFLKTKATPSIYWQPLCPQEIALKQQQRLVRMEEHKRRIEETRTRLRVPFRRR